MIFSMLFILSRPNLHISCLQNTKATQYVCVYIVNVLDAVNEIALFILAQCLSSRIEKKKNEEHNS